MALRMNYKDVQVYDYQPKFVAGSGGGMMSTMGNRIGGVDNTTETWICTDENYSCAKCTAREKFVKESEAPKCAICGKEMKYSKKMYRVDFPASWSEEQFNQMKKDVEEKGINILIMT